MKRLVADALEVEPVHWIHSLQPEQTIGAGLALYPALHRRLERTRDQLRGEKPGNVNVLKVTCRA